MPRNLSVRLGDVTRLPLAQHPLYSAIETELGPGRVSVSRASPWVGAALGAALLLPGIAGAATITVDSTDWTISTDGNCTMPEAVANANANADTTGGDCAAGAAGLDEIQFDASLIGSTINVDSPLTVVANEPLDVVGPGTRDQLVFDGGGNNRFMVAADDVSLSNITAQHFYAHGDGGAILGNYSGTDTTITVSNSRFASNVGFYGVGGAIRSRTVNVHDSRFDGNYAYWSGAVDAFSFTATNSEFIGNYAYVSAGAVGTYSANVSASTFSYNATERWDGAAINAYQATVNGSNFYYNRAGDWGGAISAGQADISADSQFVGNVAFGRGGAVNIFYSGTITNSQFAYNISGAGGAIFAGDHSYGTGLPPQLARQAHARPGAKRAKGTGAPNLSLSITGSQFSHNRAADPYGAVGGAIAAVPFTAYSGGAYSSNSVSLSGSTLNDNVAFPYQYQPLRAPAATDGKLAPGPLSYSMGGGLMVGPLNSGGGNRPVAISGQKDEQVAPPPVDVLVDINSTNFSNNLAFIGGGSLVFGSTITVDDSTFGQNGAYLGGGGIFLASSLKYGPYAAGDSATFTNTTFSDNRAGATGGGVVAMSGSVSGNGLDLLNNQTALHPGFYSLMSGGNVRPAGVVKTAKQAPTNCSFGKYAGGGVLSSFTSTQLTGASQITGNCAGQASGGVAMGTGKYGLTGSLVMAPDTLVSGNSSYGTSPGLDAYVGGSGSTGSISGTFTGNIVQDDVPGSGGGMLLGADFGASVTVSQASVSGNFATSGGGIAIDSTSGSSYGPGSVSIIDSTISGNTAVQGAGISIAQSLGGGGARASSSPRFPNLQQRLLDRGVNARFFGGKRGSGKSTTGNPPVSVSVQNTTIDGNATSSTALAFTQQGGGLFADAYSALAMDHVTITGNSTGGDGGGVMLSGVVPTATNSIIGLNTATGTGNDANGTLNIDYSLVQDATGATLNGANNLTGTDPMLDPLADNGGPTLTRLPQFGSPVVDAGDPAFVTASLPNDQRGAGFPRDAGGRTDMGAVEGITPVNLVSLAVAPTPFPEGAAATMTATLDATTNADVMVTVDFSGTALFGTDFTAGDDDPMTAGTQILIPANSLSGDITLDALTDASIEGDEPFHADVSAVSNAIESGNVAADATITDVLPPPTASLVLGPPSSPEGGGAFTVTVNLSNAFGQPIVITLNFSGSATFGVDYTVEDQDPGTPGIQIIIPPGSTSGSLLITPLNDGENEPDEDVIVQIGSVSAGSATGSPGTGTITNVAAAPGGPAAIQAPAVIPTLNEWMLMLLGLLLPAAVMVKLRGGRKGDRLDA